MQFSLEDSYMIGTDLVVCREVADESLFEVGDNNMMGSEIVLDLITAACCSPQIWYSYVHTICVI
jgi:hypothetical protein